MCFCVVSIVASWTLPLSPAVLGRVAGQGCPRTCTVSTKQVMLCFASKPQAGLWNHGWSHFKWWNYQQKVQNCCDRKTSQNTFVYGLRPERARQVLTLELQEILAICESAYVESVNSEDQPYLGGIAEALREKMDNVLCDSCTTQRYGEKITRENHSWKISTLDKNYNPTSLGSLKSTAKRRLLNKKYE